jgi:hypothetical protein
MVDWVGWLNATRYASTTCAHSHGGQRKIETVEDSELHVVAAGVILAVGSSNEMCAAGTALCLRRINTVHDVPSCTLCARADGISCGSD